MKDGMKLTLNSEPNGSVTITNSNETTRITIQPDDTVAISSYEPIQLTGATLAKLDKANISHGNDVVMALLQRLEKKTSN